MATTYNVPPYGGCPWPIDPACFTKDWEDMEPSVQARSLALASSTLERLTGYRVGNCPITVRPCVRNGCWAAFIPFREGVYGPFDPGINALGEWVNGCGCRDSCATDCEIELAGPVGRVDEVKVDGVALDPTDYEIVNGNVLVWTGIGDCPFPKSQDLKKADTEVGTFSVTYLNAYPVDSLGAYTVTVLAMEYGAACTGGKCKLPLGVTQIARQGVTMTIQTGAFPGGMTGIRVVDSYIALWNPDGLRSQPTVWSPSRKHGHNRITTWGA